MKNNIYLGVMLIISAMFLTALVPGGLVESRDFSHIHPLILISFNLFLTVLVFGSCLLGLQWFRKPASVQATLWVGVAYFMVYLLDLFAIFPVSPTPMSELLWAIEVSGLILAIPLIMLSGYALVQGEKNQATNPIVIPWKVIIPIGLVVVVYASVATICAL